MTSLRKKKPSVLLSFSRTNEGPKRVQFEKKKKIAGDQEGNLPHADEGRGGGEGDGGEVQGRKEVN